MKIRKLEKLSYRGLTIEHYQVESALKHHTIQAAVVAILSTSFWEKENEFKLMPI